MQRTQRDWLVIRGHRTGEPGRDGQIVEVRGENGEAPYLVEWSEGGHVGRVFRGPDATAEHLLDIHAQHQVN